MERWMISSIVAGMLEDEERSASSNLRNTNNNYDDDDDDYEYDDTHKTKIDYSIGIKFMRH